MHGRVAGSFARQLGKVFVSIKSQEHDHHAENHPEHDGQHQRSLNQRLSFFAPPAEP